MLFLMIFLIENACFISLKNKQKFIDYMFIGETIFKNAIWKTILYTWISLLHTLIRQALLTLFTLWMYKIISSCTIALLVNRRMSPSSWISHPTINSEGNSTFNTFVTRLHFFYTPRDSTPRHLCYWER